MLKSRGNMDTSLVLILVAALSLVVADLRLIDLTHNVGHSTIYWPGNPPFNFSKAFGFDLGNGVKVESNYFQTAEHSGTHMDAPKHFCPRGKEVHQITLDKLSGPGILLDFEDEGNKNVDFEITVEHLKDWEIKNGMIPEGAIVIMKYGWNKHWPDWNKVYNTKTVEDTSSYHWPGMTAEASVWLAEKRKIHALGTDCPGPDWGQSTTFPIHVKLLCDHAVILLEHVANVAALPTTGSRVYIGALKLEHGSGTPVRLFATVGSGCCRVATGGLHVLSLCIVMMALKLL